LLNFYAVWRVAIKIECRKVMYLNTVWSSSQKGNDIVTIWSEVCPCFGAELCMRTMNKKARGDSDNVISDEG
jgi:hypothetical protein